MATLEPFATLTGTLDFQMRGAVPAGTRIDIHFSGVVTSPHWEGERPASGIDYVTMRGDGVAELYVRAAVGEGDDVVSYEAHGLQTKAGVVETMHFQTASKDLAFLNEAVGVATGGVDGNQLTLVIALVKQ